MKAMKTQITYIFLCMVLSFLVAPQLGAQDIPPEVIKAAQEGLPVFLEVISQNNVPEGMSPFPTSNSNMPSQKALHGFEEDDPLNQAYSGEPFKFYLLNNEAALNYTRGSDVSSMLTPMDTWYFPVMIGEDTKSVLKVAKMDGSWKAVSLGVARLAVELGKIRKQWPLEQGYTPLLTVCHEISRYLFTVPQYDSTNLTSDDIILLWVLL